MNRKKRKLQKYYLEKIQYIDKITGWILLGGLLIIPLVMRATVIKYISPELINPILNTGYQTNVFTYYKWLLLIILAITLLIFLSIKILAYKYELQSGRINVLIFLLVLIMLFSTLLADYKSIALIGSYDRYEGVITFLAYLAIMFVVANIVFDGRFIRNLNIALFTVTLANLLIAFSHFFKYQLIQDLLIKLVVPASLVNLGFEGFFISTLENPNYVSGLFGSLFIYFIIFYLGSNSYKSAIFYGIGSLASFMLVLISLSTSGFLTICLVLPLMFFLIYLKNENRKQLLFLAVTILIFLSLSFTSLNSVKPSIFNESLGFFKQIKQHYTLNLQVMAAVPDEGVPLNEDMISVQPTNLTLENLPSPGIDISNGRFYIWEQVSYLIMKRPFWGYGSGTLAYYFPQYDVNKISSLGDAGTLINKSHNHYLEIAFSFGLMYLFILLLLFTNQIIIVLKNILPNTNLKNQTNTIIPMTALLGFYLAFLIQWIFNDSTIGSSIIFWVLMGVGIAITYTSHSEIS